MEDELDQEEEFGNPRQEVEFQVPRQEIELEEHRLEVVIRENREVGFRGPFSPIPVHIKKFLSILRLVLLAMKMQDVPLYTRINNRFALEEVPNNAVAFGTERDVMEALRDIIDLFIKRGNLKSPKWKNLTGEATILYNLGKAFRMCIDRSPEYRELHRTASWLDVDTTKEKYIKFDSIQEAFKIGLRRVGGCTDLADD